MLSNFVRMRICAVKLQASASSSRLPHCNAIEMPIFTLKTSLIDYTWRFLKCGRVAWQLIEVLTAITA